MPDEKSDAPVKPKPPSDPTPEIIEVEDPYTEQDFSGDSQAGSTGGE